jgi:hypothetical protein
MNTIFDIEQKQDTPEKLAAAAGKPTKHFLFAGEFNLMTDTMIQQVIDLTALDLHWVEKQQRLVYGLDANGQSILKGKVNLLGVSIKNHDLFNAPSVVKLFIDRYRPKRHVKNHTDVRSSGFKHPENQSAVLPNRKSEIVLKSHHSYIDFGQELYFKTLGTTPRATGLGDSNTSFGGHQALCYLQFRLQVTINNKVYNSKPLSVLKMLMQTKPDKTFVISYKRT